MPLSGFSAGQRLTGAQLTIVVNEINRIATLQNAAPACIVARVANQVITTATLTPISFDTELKDTDGMFTAPSSSLTCNTSGVFDVNITGSYDIGATGDRLIIVYVNGVEVAPNGRTSTPASAANTMGGSWANQISLAAGNVVSFQLYHTAGVNRNWTGRAQMTWRSTL